MRSVFLISPTSHTRYLTSDLFRWVMSVRNNVQVRMTFSSRERFQFANRHCQPPVNLFPIRHLHSRIFLSVLQNDISLPIFEHRIRNHFGRNHQTRQFRGIHADWIGFNFVGLQSHFMRHMASSRIRVVLPTKLPPSSPK